jgi:hypothetical protein
MKNENDFFEGEVLDSAYVEGWGRHWDISKKIMGLKF